MIMSLSEETKKLYYSISEVGELFDINSSTIRFWEKEFDELKPTKNKKGNRLFTQKDIDCLQQIVELVKQKGYTIQGAKEQLKLKKLKKTDYLPENSEQKSAEVITKLQNIKTKLILLRDNL